VDILSDIDKCTDKTEIHMSITDDFFNIKKTMLTDFWLFCLCPFDLLAAQNLLAKKFSIM
jgi:hypothetical protein